MHSTHSSGMRRAQPLSGSAPAESSGNGRGRASRAARFIVILCLIMLAGVLPACSSGSGGDNGSANPRGDVRASGLASSYPFNGQQDVVLDTQMVVDFAGDVSGSMDDALALQVDGETAAPAITVAQDDNQPNILRLIPDGDLQPNTTYKVVATRDISGSNTAFGAGETLLQFSTRPLEGSPADGAFAVVETSPGNTNPVTGRKTIFTQFNAIRVRLNEPVDPATVTPDTFTVTGPDGAVTDARITALGRYLVFDPVEDLAPGTYTIALSDTVTSKFGKQLAAYSVERRVLDAGDTADENLVIAPTADNVADLPDNDLNGGPINNVNIASQLIGSNDQAASAAATRGGVRTTLAQPGQPGFDDVFPAVIRAGQKFQLTGLKLFLNGDVATPINPSGPIDVNFINDVDVYLQANDYRNIESPTAVRLRFDLGIGTLITAAAGQPGTPAFAQFVVQSLANGVFNQSALNIQASGLAIPQDNGDLKLATVGTFPINVNRTDNATVDFELTLTLPGGDQPATQDDTTAPIVTAQAPSACLYAFGSPGYNPAYMGAAPTAFPEQICNGLLAQGGSTPPFVNSFPVEASPAITFSEPLDPNSVSAGSVQLVGGGTAVPATYRVEGFSVVIDPDDPLAPDTTYQITLNASDTLKDLAGNAVTFDNAVGPGATLAFKSEPQIDSNSTPPLLGTLTPGVPCALEGGDFAGGGDNAGHCTGDTPSQDASGNTADNDFAVFRNPANVSVDGFFSKFVSADSIVLADGCLVNGSGNTVGGATVAVQQMDGSGQCVGAVPGAIVTGNPGDDLTRSFSFKPTSGFEPDTRYWIVVCGSDGSACSSRIVDSAGNALNTNPLAGTGSTPTSADAAGGPDIIMPFDAVAASSDYYANTFTLPEADTNGNGQFDDINGDEQFQPGEERPQPGNRALVTQSVLGTPLVNANRDDGAYLSYLSLARPIAIRGTLDDCSAVDAVANDNGSSAVGTTPDECIQVSLLPGGVSSLSGIGISANEAFPAVTALTTALTNAQDNNVPLANIPTLGPILGGTFATTQDALAGVNAAVSGFLANAVPVNGDPINTGRILLRFPNDPDTDGNTQSGYIVEKCTGTFADGTAYDFEPCFAASLNLIANAPEGQGVVLPQQRTTANVVGPVTFQQNGRLVISLRNVNTLTLNATALGLLPATATINPAELNFQLAGSPTHGGHEFPNR